MKTLIAFLSKVYQYTTACIVIGTPLFFIPKTSFAPEITYYMVMTFLVGIALLSYVLVAILTKSWHTLSRFEFISYFVFALAVVLSVIFAKSQKLALFGEAFDQSSGAALLSLPVIMYLVRSLPEALRNKLKLALVFLLSLSAFVFVTALMYSGPATNFTKQLFSGFSSSISFAIYMGIFGLACLFYVVKGSVAKKHKVAIAVTGLLFFAWGFALLSQDAVRPNFTSTMQVGKNVLMHEGVFGIGAGNFVRAWQLYRPEAVIASAYFGYDFSQGSSMMTTLFVTSGIIGLLAFLLLTLSALYCTFISYRQSEDGKERFIIGFLFATLLYFFIVSWYLPLSYAMLVVWMVVSGLGLAKARLTEFHPHKKIAYILVPITLILVVNMFITSNKIRAFSFYNDAQKATEKQEVKSDLDKALAIYPYDGFQRIEVEYFIQANRDLVASSSVDQDLLKKTYLDNAAKAQAAGLAAVKLNTNNYQNYVSLGRAYELSIPLDKEASFEKAKKAYQEAVKLYPENPYLYIMLARLEASAGTKEGVRSQLTEALKKKQNFADALYLMSQLEASDSKIDEALNYALEAVKNAPNDPLVYVQAGLLYYGKKDYQNAVYALKTALEKDQNNANVAYFLALALRDGGRPDIAKQIGDELLRRNPGNTDLQKFLASLSPKAATTTAATAKKAKK